MATAASTIAPDRDRAIIITRICVRSPDGTDYWMHGVYREIAPPERLVFTHVWEDGHGAAGHETLITVTFEAIGAKTKMTFRKAVLISIDERNAQHAGWSECFDRLGVYVGEVAAGGKKAAKK